MELVLDDTCSLFLYVTGHETNFVAWLLCLQKLGLIEEAQHKSVVLGVCIPSSFQVSSCFYLQGI